MDATIDLAHILALHRKWLACEKGGVKADLGGTDLYKADLHGAKLGDANLRGAYLLHADLHGADLHRVDLREAMLCSANLRGVNLRGANLRGAYLSSANLYQADLYKADLYQADLYKADLREANLSNTYLDPHLTELQRTFCRACPADADGYRIVYRTSTSLDVKGTIYIPGHTYEAPVFSADIMSECHPGIYAGSLAWMRAKYPTRSLVKCRVQDGDWFITAKGAIRTCRLEVLEYVNNDKDGKSWI